MVGKSRHPLRALSSYPVHDITDENCERQSQTLLLINPMGCSKPGSLGGIALPGADSSV